MDNTLVISRSLLNQILAIAASDDEVCGLLFGECDRIDEALPCGNVAADPSRRFEIDPAALIAAHRNSRNGGPRIVGHYHSHPSGSPIPSAADAASAPPDGAIWLIVAGGEARAWRAVRDGAVHGRFDPVDLAVHSPCAPDSAPSQGAKTSVRDDI